MHRLVDTGSVHGHSYVRVAGRADAERVLVVVPGLNDPLKRVGDARWFASLMAIYLRRYRDRHAVYMLSRPHGLGGARSTAAMARRYEPAIDALATAEGVDAVDLLGLSLGGFVVQHLAATRPDRVDRAVLGLAGTELSAAGRERLQRWRALARHDRWRPIYTDAYGLVASGATARALQVAAVGYDLVAAPDHPEDFEASIDASLDHDGRDALHDVAVPTLVVGGTRDPFFDERAFRDATRRLADGRLALLDGVGHDAVLEHPLAFDGAVTRFLYEEP
ncbi:alpha/beta hydrolase [Halorubellus sp. JP-L1]|uniref:alpha/beta fold hydrolase n=1 Tax=Halorubellus sp. JP-L1 TaxID=2715753 RepID=UPI00140DB484|nr:alpha/beta hydrolase [Halorubellus sp. JP-L1]NHN40257.1 alpha/beta hydrolase [Halorubellus sp. JP-L1]